ncbi:MAG: hypothetical protein ACP5RJ_02765 [Conexivisphaera sp.]
MAASCADQRPSSPIGLRDPVRESSMPIVTCPTIARVVVVVLGFGGGGLVA